MSCMETAWHQQQYAYTNSDMPSYSMRSSHMTQTAVQPTVQGVTREEVKGQIYPHQLVCFFSL